MSSGPKYGNTGKAVGALLMLIGLIFLLLSATIPLIAPALAVIFLLAGFYIFTMKKTSQG